MKMKKIYLNQNIWKKGNSMNIIDIIDKKRKKEELTDEEIKYVIEGFCSGLIKDYQMSSLLMAIVINDMTDNEVYSLTKYMVDSGSKIDFSMIHHLVDKHSTGGVGDKTTLIISPIVACCNVYVAKMSGRGLGHTGGTVDKLESIPGFNVNLTKDEFINQIKTIGMAVVSQTESIAIADKKIYALRDVTGTVESIPLIASSIMSKKIACGSKNLVIDLKVGNGALIKNIDDARRLANLMINIGKKNDIKVVCLLTNMDVPLGNNIGNSLEVKEVIDILKNNKKGPLYELCVELSSYMVSLGLNISYEEAKENVIKNIENGNAYNKFIEFVNYQKGDLEKLPEPLLKCEIKANKSGYLTKLNAFKLGKIACATGAGRIHKEDVIDYSSGVIVNRNINDYVNVGDTVYTIYSNKKVENIDIDCFEISDNKNENIELIYEIIK